jgi:hypothetical protein
MSIQRLTDCFKHCDCNHNPLESWCMWVLFCNCLKNPKSQCTAAAAAAAAAAAVAAAAAAAAAAAGAKKCKN